MLPRIKWAGSCFESWKELALLIYVLLYTDVVHCAVDEVC